jgi:hypothetical protein
MFDNDVVTMAVNGGAPIGSGITQTKWVVTWSEPDLNNVADIDISVWDTCPAGGVPVQLVASQSDYDLRNRIDLRTPNITGKCLEKRFVGFSVPPAGRLIYSSDLFHSGTPF